MVAVAHNGATTPGSPFAAQLSHAAEFYRGDPCFNRWRLEYSRRAGTNHMEVTSSQVSALPRVLVTGGTGFVGSALVKRLQRDARHRIRISLRQAASAPDSNVAAFSPYDLSDSTIWQPALAGVDVVVHAAARVHVMNDAATSPLAEFRRVNVEGSIALARQAAAAGVKRFIFVSSIKVNGEATSSGHPYRAADPPRPVDPYGISKLEAEVALHRVASDSGMELVIIRPPLVYGPGVRANFRSMLGWLNRGVPLPFGAIDNRRSMVAIDNLVDLIVTCLDHDAAVGKTFLVCDDEDLSTTELLRRCARALGRPARLIPVPATLVSAAARFAGRADLAQRLCGSLQADMEATRSILGWRPAITTDEALARTAKHFLTARN